MFMKSRVSSSSAEKGSSSRSTAGSVISIRQIAARCAIPPESSPGIDIRRLSQSDQLEELSRPPRRIARRGPVRGGPRSATRHSRWWSSRAGALPAGTSFRYRRAGPITGRCSSTTRPEVGGMSPAMTFRSVDLPHPEGPMTEANSPRPRTRYDIVERAQLIARIDLGQPLDLVHRPMAIGRCTRCRRCAGMPGQGAFHPSMWTLV